MAAAVVRRKEANMRKVNENKVLRFILNTL
jgi:hypothetical protein